MNSPYCKEDCPYGDQVFDKVWQKNNNRCTMYGVILSEEQGKPLRYYHCMKEMKILSVDTPDEE
jgi:Fe-S-cluster-containing dehydrogenase component